MDAFGTASSAATLIFQLFMTVKKVRETYHDAPEGVKRQAGELETLHNFIQRVEKNEQLRTPEVERILQRCREEAKKLLEAVEPLRKSFEEPEDDAGGKGGGSVAGKTWKSVKLALYKEKDVMDMFAVLERQKTSLGNEINLAGLNVGISHQNQLASVEQKITRKLDRLTMANNTDFEKCMRDIFVTDPNEDRDRLLSAKGPIAEGTCAWIEESDAYKNWLETESSGLLWISGGPGMGKTMLSIHLSQHIEKHAKAKDPTGLVAFFFCDNKESRRNAAAAVLRGLLYHLLYQDAGLFEHLEKEYTYRGEKIFEDGSFETLWRIFLDVVRDTRIPVIYGLIDALDEIGVKSMKTLVSKIQELYREADEKCRLRLIVVSREYPVYLPERLRLSTRIRLNSEPKVQESIRIYIKGSVTELAEMKGYPPLLQERVESALGDNANGTFLWVSFVLKELDEKTPSEVDESLDNLPSGVDEVYERMLKQVTPERREVVRNILLWATFGMESLSLEDLATVAGVKATRYFDVKQVMREKVGHCGHLLIIVGEKVSLVHQSAKDFLLSRRPNAVEADYFPSLPKEEEVHADMAGVCLDAVIKQHKSQNGQQPTPVLDRWGNLAVSSLPPLLSYSVAYWPEHMRCTDSMAMKNVIHQHREFFDDVDALKDWYLAAGSRQHESRDGHFQFDLLSPIHVAALVGLIPLGQHHLSSVPRTKRSDALNRRAGETTALSIAIDKGYLDMMEFLLKKGAMPTYYALRRALLAAATSSSDEFVTLLIRYGAEPCLLPRSEKIKHPLRYSRAKEQYRPEGVYARKEAENQVFFHFASPLDQAVQDKNAKAVEMLLENSKWAARDLKAIQKAIRDPDRRMWNAIDRCLSEKDGKMLFGNTPPEEPNILWDAVATGDLEMVTHLKRKYKLDLWQLWEGGSCPLSLAAGAGNVEFLDGLIKESREDNTPERLEWLAKDVVRRASLDGFADIVDLMVSKYGADPAGEWMGNVPIHHAADRGRAEVVDRLVGKLHVDPNQRDKEGNTALHLSAFVGSTDTLNVLLGKHHVHPNQTGENGKTALHFAAQSRKKSVEALEILVDKYNVDPKQLDGAGSTALHYAVGWASVEIIKTLIDKYHLDPNQRNWLGDTPIHAAADYGWRDQNVRLLIEKYGVDPKQRNACGDTVGHVYAYHGSDPDQADEFNGFLFNEFGLSRDDQNGFGETAEACFGQLMMPMTGGHAERENISRKKAILDRAKRHWMDEHRDHWTDDSIAMPGPGELVGRFET
ncbi:ankyrin repeat protein [Zalerion maritima]|uniref:Ankyrin repeat protein n=1 Tax=Zalerion maritima TaxID=339359 RepID=A0AAD5RTJ2_9PEZI|nr:ankyrin repeat protein [Zalerion maritima]